MTSADLQTQYPGFRLTGMPGGLLGKKQAWDMKLQRQSDAYHGVYPNPLKVPAGAPNDNVILNLSRVIVDKSVSFLFGKSVSYNLDEESTRSPAEKYLDNVFTLNLKDVLLQNMAINGGIYGQAFVKIRIAKPYPKLLVLDPSKVTVETAYDDHTLVNAYYVRWDAPDPQDAKRRIAFRQKIERRPEEWTTGDLSEPLLVPEHWIITDQKAEARYDSIIDENAWINLASERWNYSFPPIVECQNLPSPNSYWGQSDIEPDVLGLIEAANKALSNINKVIRNHAHPKTYTIGLEGSQMGKVNANTDNILHIPGDAQQVKIGNLEMQSDLASSLNFYDRLRDAIYELSRTPEVASGKVQDLSYLSAMAMQILYGPMVEKTRTKRATYGYMLIELCRRLLAIAGQGEDQVVTMVWPDVFPRDEQVESLTAINKLEVGFSKDTVITSLGGDPAYERERRQADIEEEAKKAEMTQPPEPPGSGSGGNTQPRGETPPAKPKQPTRPNGPQR